MRKDILLVAALLMLTVVGVQAQTFDTLRVMTYNILNYPGTQSAVRNPAFREILDYVNPDILVVQEMLSSAGVSEFLNSVLNVSVPGEYSSAPFVNGPDTDNACFYKSSRVSYISQTILATELRDITGYKLRPVGVGADSLDIQIFSAHLKSSQGFESERFGEADTLRNHLNGLPSGGWFIAAGDFNLYTSTEPAYGELTGSQADNSGRLHDPLNPSLVTQDWNDNFSFRFIHSQSPRATAPSPDDGGTLGGMDDRFDFILPSTNYLGSSGWQYLSGSYTTVGQDGAHFNANVNDAPTNTSVPVSIANALHRAADHLPVHIQIVRQISPPPSITVIFPDGGETLYAGETANLQWSSSGVSGTVTIKINRTYPAGSFTNLIAGTADDGVQSWLVTSPVTSTARIQIVSDTQPAVSDVSNSNFSIANPSLVLSSPNGGETWDIGSNRSISWSGSGFSGNVSIDLTRTWPVASWESLFSNSANDGNELWAVSGPVSSTARIRVMSIGNALAGDTSAANFSIVSQLLTLTSPNGGELWLSGQNRTIGWTTLGLTGNAKIEINRFYPAGAWELLFSSVSLSSGTTPWVVSLPTSNTARVRITSLIDTTKFDISDGHFEIRQPSALPVVKHDPHGDALPGTVTFTAKVTDDGAGPATKLFYKTFAAALYDSLDMTATGFPNEFSASALLSFGRYRYYLRAVDNEGQVVTTAEYLFMVSAPSSGALVYDDGSAETFQWSQTDSMQWAVRFTPNSFPFVLSEAEVGIAAYHPDSSHQQLRIKIFLADGPGGTPGTLVREMVRGSVGNLVGGLGAAGMKLARIVLFDELTAPYQAAGDVFISVANVTGGKEAFALDSTPPHSGRSYVFRSCSNSWISEQVADPITRNGDRVIRLKGWALTPPQIVVMRSGTDARLHWPQTGAPYYRVFSSPDANGSFATFEGTATDTTFTDVGAVGTANRLFYRVVSSSQP